MASMQSIIAGLTYVKLSIETSEFQKGLSKTKREMLDLGKTVTMVGATFANFGAILASPFAKATSIFMEFDNNMRAMKAASMDMDEEWFNKLNAHAREIGQTTALTASQAAAAMGELARAGFNPKEIDDAIDATTNLALATGTDLAQASNIAANSLRIFNLNANQSGRVADVLTATANGSAQTLTDLFEALKLAGPQAVVAGESIEDTAAAIGMLANTGIKGSMAGTALRRAFANMANLKTQDYLKGFNIQTTDANGNLRKMKDILLDVGKAMETMTSAEKIQFAEEVFEMRGAFVGLNIGAHAKELQKFANSLANVNGAAQKTANERQKGIGGAFNALKSATEEMLIALSSSINGMLVPIIKGITWVAVKLGDFLANWKSLGMIMASVSAILITAGAAFTALGLAIRVALGAQGAYLALSTKLTTVLPILTAKAAAVKTFFTAFATAHPAILAITGITAAIYGLIKAQSALTSKRVNKAVRRAEGFITTANEQNPGDSEDAIKKRIQAMRESAAYLAKSSNRMSKGGFWNNLKNATWNHFGFNEAMETYSSKIDKIMTSIAEEEKKLRELQGKKSQVKPRISSIEAANATKRLTEIDNDIQNDKLTDLDKELAKIKDLRTEYIKLLETKLAFEKQKASPDNITIAELEAKLKSAPEVFNGMEKAAYDEANKDKIEDIAGLAKQKDQDRKNQTDLDQFQKRINNITAKGTLAKLLDKSREAVAKLVDEYQKTAETFKQENSDGAQFITEDEQKRLEAIKARYNQQQSKTDAIRERLKDISSDFNKKDNAASRAVSMGTFITADLKNLMGSQTKSDRKIAENTSRTNTLLERLVDVTRELQNNNIVFG